jgi:hypothetical protein
MHNNMSSKLTNPKIEWCRIKDNNCLWFTFEGELTASEASDAVEIWQEIFSGSSQKKITVVWDCLKMTSYDITARKTWQKAMKRMKNRIDKCLIVTNNQHIRYGAMILSLFTSIDIKVSNNLTGVFDCKSITQK